MDDLDSYFDLTSVAQLPVELFLFSVVPYNYGKSTVQKRETEILHCFISDNFETMQELKPELLLDIYILIYTKFDNIIFYSAVHFP